MTDKADWHPEDVKAAIRKSGLTMSALSKKLGYNPSCVRIALRRPWPKLEAMIAQHLRQAPWDIWPSRYDARGRSLKGPSGRPRGLRSSARKPVTHRKSGAKA